MIMGEGLVWFIPESSYFSVDGLSSLARSGGAISSTGCMVPQLLGLVGTDRI
jgi:hypothetical protein